MLIRRRRIRPRAGLDCRDLGQTRLPADSTCWKRLLIPLSPPRRWVLNLSDCCTSGSLLELTGDELTARHAKFQLAAMYSEADRETFIICLFQNWVRWDGTHFVFLSPDPTEPGLYGRGVSRRLGEMYLLSRLIECENDTFRFASPEAAEAPRRIPTSARRDRITQKEI